MIDPRGDIRPIICRFRMIHARESDRRRDQTGGDKCKHCPFHHNYNPPEVFRNEASRNAFPEATLPIAAPPFSLSFRPLHPNI